MTTGPFSVVTASAVSSLVSSMSSLVTRYFTSAPATPPALNALYFALLTPVSSARNAFSTPRASPEPGLPVQMRRKPMFPAGLASTSQAAVTVPW